MLSEHVIERYEVQERQPKGKMSPALHNTDLEQKKPRRKDTPALHMSPFAAGKRAGAGHLQGVVGTGQEHYHLEVPQACLCPGPAVCVTQKCSGEEQHLPLFSGLPPLAASPGPTRRWTRVRALLMLQQNWSNFLSS